MSVVRAVLVVALGVAVVGCDEEGDADGVLLGSGGEASLLGVWTGTEEISTADFLGPSPLVGSAAGVRFVFPVALEFRPGRRFELFGVGFPVPGGGDLERERVCTGLFDRDGATLEFFPETVCRALPLTRFVIGGFGPGGLELEARSRPALPGRPGAEGASVRVHIRVERDRGPGR